MPITALAIGAGVGLLKSQTVDKDKEKRQRALAAETQRYSPWTGLHADPIQQADPFGSALQFGATGAALGQNAQSASDMHDYMQNNPYGAKVNYNVNSPTGGGLSNNPWSGFNGPNPYSV
jgi:hypothetical protein